VIHTVGPVWHGGNGREAEMLASAYRESLKLANSNQLKSISFPSISTGAYGYPLPDAAEVALSTVAAFLKKQTTLEQVYFVLYDAGILRTYCDILAELNP
jgi:O-acetyl-ADP-ribose deacetylase (regulator of RNase III)